MSLEKGLTVLQRSEKMMEDLPFKTPPQAIAGSKVSKIDDWLTLKSTDKASGKNH